MKVSYKWINEYLNNKAPSPEKIKDLLTMHSMEVEGLEKIGSDTVIDVKTLPNNSHSCLCHRGIAREVGVITGIKPNLYSRKFKDIVVSKTSKDLKVKIEDPKLCRRYIGRVVENVKVGESPKWLKEKLETLGQRSINNIVRNHNIDGIDQDDFKKMYIDATSEPRNFFMLDLKGKSETRYRHNFIDFILP